MVKFYYSGGPTIFTTNMSKVITDQTKDKRKKISLENEKKMKVLITSNMLIELQTFYILLRGI